MNTRYLKYAAIGLGLITLAAAPTYTALVLRGSSSGTLTLKSAAIAGTGSTLTLPGGTTDFSATGGTSDVVKQTSTGAAFTVARLACADLSDSGAGCSGSGSGLTFTDGTHTVTSSTQLTVTGGTIGGTTPNATLTISASASSFTPGTTTILGATAPCFLVNSTSTTSACDALGTGVATAMSNAVNTSGGLLTTADAANPTGTAGPTAVNGSATTFMRSDAAPAVQKGSNAQFGIIEGDGQTITCVTGVCSGTAPGRTVTTSPTVLSTDMGGQIVSNVSGGGTLTIPAISSTVFATGMSLSVVNYSASTEAVTTTPTVNAGGGCVTGTGIPSGDSWQIQSNGTTLDCIQTTSSSSGGAPTFTSITSGTNTAAAMVVGSGASLAVSGSGTIGATSAPLAGISGLGTGVGTALGNNLSAAGGVSSTIASGTSALGTSLISSGACATVVTTTATNVATTDVIAWGFNGDPTGVTGYTPVTTGALTIFAYPSSGNVNFKTCNLTSASITPGAITLNWRVAR